MPFIYPHMDMSPFFLLAEWREQFSNIKPLAQLEIGHGGSIYTMEISNG